MTPAAAVAWCMWCHHGEVAHDPCTAHTALEAHYRAAHAHRLPREARGA